MASEDNRDSSCATDVESSQPPISPAGEGDAKAQLSEHTKGTDTKEIKPENTNDNAQLTKKSLFARFLGDLGFTRGSHDSNAASENKGLHKGKAHTLGKLFRNKSASSARREYSDPNAGSISHANSSDQAHKKSPFGSLFSVFQRGRAHANALPWNSTSEDETDQLPKQRGGSLGKFFRYGQGKKNKESENVEKRASTGSLEEIDSESEFVTLPLDRPPSPYVEEPEDVNEAANFTQEQRSIQSTPRSESSTRLDDN